MLSSYDTMKRTIVYLDLGILSLISNYHSLSANLHSVSVSASASVEVSFLFLIHFYS